MLLGINNTIQQIAKTGSLLNQLASLQPDIIATAFGETKNKLNQLYAILNPLLNPLEELFNTFLNTNNDMTSEINEIKTNTNNISQIIDFNNILDIIPIQFNSTYQSFENINASFKSINLFMHDLNKFLNQLSWSNGKTLISNCIYCHSSNCSIDFIYSQINEIDNVFQAFNQLNSFLVNYEDTLYNNYINYRYELYLIDTYSLTSSIPGSQLVQLVNNIYLDFSSLIKLINSTSELVNCDNNLKNCLVNLVSMINSTINSINQSMSYTCTLETVVCYELEKLIDILKVTSNYSESIFNKTFLNNDKLKSPSFTLFDNNTFLWSYLTQSKNWLETLVKITLKWSLIDFKLEYIDQIRSLNDSISWCMSTSYSLAFISQLETNISNHSYSNASLILSEVAGYLNLMVPMFTSLSKLANNSLFLNDFLNLTNSFILFCRHVSILELSVDDQVSSSLQSIIFNLNTASLSQRDFILFLLNSSANSYVFAGIWNDWQPWTYCYYYRERKDLLTNKSFNENGIISCDRISK